MTGYVVDASVAVKWLADEAFSDEATSLLTSGSTLAAPALIYAEVINAFWAMHRRGEISAADLSAAVDTLKAAPIAVPFSMLQLAASAARLATDLDHPAYDCFYLALAIQTHYPVVTADSRFHNRVRGHAYLSDCIVHVSQAVAGQHR